MVSADTFDALLARRLPQTGFFGARFRECAGRALLLPRRSVQQRMPLWLTRLRARKLLSAVSAYTDFPILMETWRTCLQDEFDLPQVRRLLRELESGAIARSYVHTPFPCPLARAAAWQQVNDHMYQGDRPAPGRSGQLTADLLREVTLEPALRPDIDAGLAENFEKKIQRLAQGYAPQEPEELLEWVKERVALPLPQWDALLEASARDRSPSDESPAHWLETRIVLLIPDGGARAGGGEGVVVARDRLAAVWAAWYRHLRPMPEIQLANGTPLDPPPRPAHTIAAMDRQLSPAAEQLGQWLRFYGPIAPAAIAETLRLPFAFLEPILEELAAARLIISGLLLKGGRPDDVCDRENFERLLRLSRQAALPRIATRPIEHLALFLARFQGLTQPSQDADDLVSRMNQLLCWTAPAAAWEGDILPARFADYQPQWLDDLMQTHELRWVGQNGRKILFCFEEDLDLIHGAQPPNSDPDAADPSGLKEDDPAGLLPDLGGRYPLGALERIAGVSTAALNEKLWRWVWRAKVSNDTFAALRRGLESGFNMPAPSATQPSRAPRTPGRAAFQRWRRARPGVGNWFRLDYPEPAEDPLAREERNKERVRLLLDRYGILFRELLSRELPMLRWPALFRSLRLMELSGEVLCGHFFEGIEGLQFISPPALESLATTLPADAVFWLSGIDPASLCGLGLASLRGSLPRRLPGVHLVYHGLRPVLFSHSLGARLDILVPADHPRLWDYFGFLDHLLTRRNLPLRGIRIRQINGTPAAGQKGYAAVLADRFDTIADHRELTLYRRHGRG